MGNVDLLRGGVVLGAEAGDHAWTKRFKVGERPLERPGLEIVKDAQVVVLVELMVEPGGELIIVGMADRDRLVVMIRIAQIRAMRINIRAWNKAEQVKSDGIQAIRWND